jgi:stage II sporulation protein M
MVKRNFLVDQYSKCWKFFVESRWHIVFALGIFALTFLIGFVYPQIFRAEIFSFIKELMAMLEGKSVIELMSFIFFNNLKASFMAMVLGIGIGIFPLVTGVINGYLLGFVSREAVSIGGLSVLWQLAPHGIFELPAILFSIGIGLKIGGDMFSGEVGKKLKHNFREGLRFFVFVVFPLLLIAAIIEGLLIGALG